MQEPPLAITFDDVLLLPRYSEVVPSDVDVSTHLTRRIELKLTQRLSK